MISTFFPWNITNQTWSLAYVDLVFRRTWWGRCFSMWNRNQVWMLWKLFLYTYSRYILAEIKSSNQNSTTSILILGGRINPRIPSLSIQGGFIVFVYLLTELFFLVVCWVSVTTRQPTFDILAKVIRYCCSNNKSYVILVIFSKKNLHFVMLLKLANSSTKKISRLVF